MSGRRHSSLAWALAALAVVAGIVVGPGLFGGKVLSAQDVVAARDPALGPPGIGVARGVHNPLLFDAAYVFHPDLRAIRESIHDGRIPTWTSGIAGGRPLLASQQHGAYSPLTWLAFVLPFERSLAVIVALKLLLAGLGTFLLARAMGQRPPGALLSALAFSLSSYFVAWLQHPHSGAYLLLPWAMLAVRRLVERPTVHRAGAVGVAAGLMLLAGHPPSAAISLTLVLAYGCFLLARDWRLRTLGYGAAGAVFAVAIGAAALLPFFDLLSQTEDYERGLGPASPTQALSLIAPGWWGDPRGESFGGPSNFAERTMYLGGAPLALGLLGLLLRLSAERIFLLLCAVAAFVVAAEVSVVTGLLRDLPGAETLNLNRSIVVSVFCLALLGGFGLDAVVGGGRRVRWIACTVAGLALIPFAGWVAAGTAASAVGDSVAVAMRFEVPATEGTAQLGAALRWMVVGLTTALLVRAAARRRAAIAPALAVVGLTAVELVVPAAYYHTFLPVERADPGPSTAVADLRQTPDHQRIVGQATIEPNLALRYGLRDARGHDHPPVERYSRLWTALGGGGRIRTSFSSEAPQPEKLLSLFAVRRLLLKVSDPSPAGLRIGSIYPNDVAVADNPAAFPRAWVAYGSRPAANADVALRSVVDAPTASLMQSPFIEGGRAAVGPAAHAADIVRDENDEVVVRFDASRPAHLLLADTFLKGWRAEVDGRATTIKPANAAFRAVEVPAGHHEVRFRYAPASVEWGIWISGLAFLLAGGVALLGAIRAATNGHTSLAGRVIGDLRDLDPASVPAAAHDLIGAVRTRWRLSWTRMARSLPEFYESPPNTDAHQAEPLAPSPKRRPWDSRVVLLVLVVPFAGAALGGLLAPLPDDRFRSEALVAIHADIAPIGDEQARQRVRWHAFAGVLEVPEVAEAAATEAGVADAGPGEVVRAVGNPESGFLRVQAHADSQPAADGAANAATSAAVAVLRRAARSNLAYGSLNSTFDFEDAQENWGAGRSIFASPPERLRRDEREAHSGTGALLTSCDSEVAGCGPHVRLRRVFRTGVRYVARGYVRSDDPERLRLVLGAGPSDVGAGRTATVEGEWAPVEAGWTPSRTYQEAEIAVQTTTAGAASFHVDSVSLEDPDQPLLDPSATRSAVEQRSRLAAERAATEDRYTIVNAARRIAPVQATTGTWVLLGALAALAAVCGGLAFAALARRRNQQSQDEPDPEVEPVAR